MLVDNRRGTWRREVSPAPSLTCSTATEEEGGLASMLRDALNSKREQDHKTLHSRQSLPKASAKLSLHSQSPGCLALCSQNGHLEEQTQPALTVPRNYKHLLFTVRFLLHHKREPE